MLREPPDDAVQRDDDGRRRRARAHVAPQACTSVRRPKACDGKRPCPRICACARTPREEADERAALLVSLCKKTCKEGVLVILRSKKLAHQMRVVFGILGMKSDELHGDLTQEQACFCVFD